MHDHVLDTDTFGAFDSGDDPPDVPFGFFLIGILNVLPLMKRVEQDIVLCQRGMKFPDL